MSRPYSNDDLGDLEDLHEPPPADREISLGTGAILGIFLALVLVCGAFFGLGYSLGHRNTPATTAEAEPSPPVTTTTAGSSRPMTADSTGPAERPSGTPALPTVSPRALPLHARELPADQAAEHHAQAAAPAGERPVAATAPTPAGSGSFYVQISAVSHPEDAQTLVTALKHRGYEAQIRHVPQDALLHVQIGPYGTRKDAEAARQHLIADGYNAILK